MSVGSPALKAPFPYAMLYNDAAGAVLVTPSGHFTTESESVMQNDSMIARADVPELKPLRHRGEEFPGYFAGADGSVWTELIKPLRPLKPYPITKEGNYLGVALRRDGKTFRMSVHSVVAEAFIGPRPEGLQIRHLDGNGFNNAAANLAYGTNAENQADKIGHGTHQYGQQNPSAKLSNEQAEEIKRLRAGGVPLKDLAERFGVRESTISRIANGVRRATCI